MNQQLIFGADCVINLDDLGQFKDYSDTIRELLNQLNALKSNKKNEIPESLWQIITADPQDTFHLPQFSKVLEKIVQIQWQTFDLPQTNMQNIFSFLLVATEQCLLSYTFAETLLGKVINKVCKWIDKFPQNQTKLLSLFGKLMTKVMFFEDLQAVGDLWSCLDQQNLFKFYTKQQKDQAIAVYIECCQQFTRDRRLRLIFNKSTTLKNRPFLAAKLSLWRGDIQSVQTNFKTIESFGYYDSPFLQKMCENIVQRWPLNV